MEWHGHPARLLHGRDARATPANPGDLEKDLLCLGYGDFNDVAAV